MEKSEPPGGTAHAPPMITANDLVQTLRLLVVGVFSWIVPSVFWPRLAVALAALDRRIRPDEIARQTEMFAAMLGDTPPPADIVQASVAANYEDRLQLFRDYRPGGLAARKRGSTANSICADALARRKGVILWTSYFVYSRANDENDVGAAPIQSEPSEPADPRVLEFPLRHVGPEPDSDPDRGPVSAGPHPN